MFSTGCFVSPVGFDSSTVEKFVSLLPVPDYSNVQLFVGSVSFTKEILDVFQSQNKCFRRSYIFIEAHSVQMPMIVLFSISILGGVLDFAREIILQNLLVVTAKVGCL